ncbi:MAG TPA: hypothetical protein VLM18_11905 [Croceibacterium sp.]|nr:hypothetical protein [Croceibacterium sp.]
MSRQSVSKAPAQNWENEGGSVRPTVSPESLGVIRVVTETFVVGAYSYTNLADAVAQGRRMQASGAGQ